jgi:thiol-disulfide isomerase/thioredoxin
VGVGTFTRNAVLVALALTLFVLPPPTYSAAVQALVVMTMLAATEGWLLGLVLGKRPSGVAEEPITSVAPDVLLRTLTGQVRRYPGDVVRQAQTIVVFIDPMCSPCKRLLPKLAAMQAAHDGSAGFRIVSQGAVDANRSLAAVFGLSSVLLQADFELAQLFGVRGTPAAVVVGRSGAASGPPVHGADEVAALLALGSGNGHHHTHDRSPAPMPPPGASSHANRLIPADAVSERPTVVLRSAPGAAGGRQISTLGESVAAAHHLVVLVRERPVAAQPGEHVLDPEDRIAGELGLVETPSCRVLDPLGNPIGPAALGLETTAATLRALLVRHTEVRPWHSH